MQNAVWVKRSLDSKSTGESELHVSGTLVFNRWNVCRKSKDFWTTLRVV